MPTSYQAGAQAFEILYVPGVEGQLVGVGAPLRAHSHRLAAPDQLAPAPSKMLPAAEGVFGWATIEGAIPAFHGLDAKAVADDKAIFQGIRLPKWAGAAWYQLLVKAQV
jgi:hypothetical protein